MRAVLDTNVLISGLLWRGTPHECLLAAEAELYTLVSAEPILDELRNKLVEKFLNTPAEADEAIAGLRRVSTLVSLAGKGGWVAADPEDDKFIEAALVSGADAIVSGDHHLFDLGTIETIPILRPRQFLERLSDPESQSEDD